MTGLQEDALYDFLETTEQAFTSAEAATAIRRSTGSSTRRLHDEVDRVIRSRRLAFSLDDGQRWLSRRGFFADAVFTIKPTRLELRNGILIPGHRCIPFANPGLLPYELSFTWQGTTIPVTSSEGPPEEFYPYYDLFGEEYAPQYLAKENPLNEEAFNADPYQDPPEVSIKVLDMRLIFRESGFVPGDYFEVRTLDWPGGRFELRHIPKTSWPDKQLEEWRQLAEEAFFKSFDRLGPGSSTEEQITFAFWYGGDRMKRTPAHSTEDFLYEITERIDLTSFGMESRFWRFGKDIPDDGSWLNDSTPPDQTELELLLASLGLPISEYVVEAYVRDAFYRKATEIHEILDHLIPESIQVTHLERLYIAQFISETRDAFSTTYNYFADKDMGPLRQRTIELHRAIIDLSLKLSAEGPNASWLPKHAFVTLAQLQLHAASLLEDLDFDEAPDDRELVSIENSLDAMMDSFDEIIEAVDEARDAFRRSRFSLVNPVVDQALASTWWTIQLSIAGTKVWRRLLVPDWLTLKDLHHYIQLAFTWNNTKPYVFSIDGQSYGPSQPSDEADDDELTVGTIAESGIREFSYDYLHSTEWVIKLNLLNALEPTTSQQPHCLSGEGSAPPETIGGPLRFRRFLLALNGPDGPEKQLALSELGPSFNPEAFDLEQINQALTELFYGTDTKSPGSADD